MRLSLLSFIIGFSLSAMAAQQQPAVLSGADTSNDVFISGTAPSVSYSGQAAPRVSFGPNMTARGPLVSLFKSEKVSDVPKRLLQFVNPFAPTTAPAHVEKFNVTTRAWSTSVGWHPGGSAFPDAATHEPTMALLSVGR